MDIRRRRAETFTLYVGLELKGKITSRGFTATNVAQSIGRSPAAFNRWLNGKVEIPMTVVCEVSEYIDVEPASIVEAAYDRLAFEFGERDGSLHVDTPDGLGTTVPGGDVVTGSPDGVQSDDRPRLHVVPPVQDEPIRSPALAPDVQKAAKRGTRKADQQLPAE